MKDVSDEDHSEDDRRFEIGGRAYDVVWAVFVVLGAVAAIVVSAELLAKSGVLNAEQSTLILQIVELARTVVSYIWPLCIIAMPAIFMFAFGGRYRLNVPFWVLIWIPLSVCYGHSLLLNTLFKSGLFGEDVADHPSWNLFFFSGKYIPYAVNVALKGAALDFMESFQIAISQPEPTRQIIVFRMLEFAFRTIYSAWGALVVIKVVSFVRRNPQDLSH